MKIIARNRFRNSRRRLPLPPPLSPPTTTTITISGAAATAVGIKWSSRTRKRRWRLEQHRHGHWNGSPHSLAQQTATSRPAVAGPRLRNDISGARYIISHFGVIGLLFRGVCTYSSALPTRVHCRAHPDLDAIMLNRTYRRGRAHIIVVT